jgi:hypothetical protein
MIIPPRFGIFACQGETIDRKSLQARFLPRSIASGYTQGPSFCACARSAPSKRWINRLRALFRRKTTPLAKAVGMVGLVLVVGQALILVTGIFGDRPAQLLAWLGLFWSSRSWFRCSTSSMASWTRA